MATAHSEHSFEAHVRPTLEVFVIKLSASLQHNADAEMDSR